MPRSRRLVCLLCGGIYAEAGAPLPESEPSERQLCPECLRLPPAAGAAAYVSSEQAAAQARDQKKAAKNKAEAERQATMARRKHVLWEAGKREKGMLSARASAGVQVGEGASLLENEMEFASAAEYDAQLSEFPHLLNSAQGRLHRETLRQPGEPHQVDAARDDRPRGRQLAGVELRFVRRQARRQRHRLGRVGVAVADLQLRQLAEVTLFAVAAVLVRVAWRLPGLRVYPAGQRAERCFFWISVAAFVVALVALNS